jgi:hypothetical protein
MWIIINIFCDHRVLTVHQSSLLYGFLKGQVHKISNLLERLKFSFIKKYQVLNQNVVLFSTRIVLLLSLIREINSERFSCKSNI